MQGQRIGYARVSSFDQNPDRQLEQIDVGKVFTDKASGKDTQRPELERLLAFVREGDTVVVHSMDRLARNLDDLRRTSFKGLTRAETRTNHQVASQYEHPHAAGKAQTRWSQYFHGKRTPDYDVFLYFSCVIGTFGQTVDPCGELAWCIVCWPSSSTPH